MEKNELFYNFIKGLLRLPIKIFFPYSVKGRENVENIKGSYILCSNHLSNIDPVFLLVINSEQINFMAKSELFKNKIFGYILKKLGAFSVDRGKGDKKALVNAENVLKNKAVLGIFIEGTRSKTGEFLRPKSGAALLAYKSRVPVIPVCITGSGTNNKVKIFKKTVISYGKPIYINEIPEITEINVSMLRSMSNDIMEKIKEMR